MSINTIRLRQTHAVKQLLRAAPLGCSRPELQTLLGKRADPKQLIATINAMKSNGEIVARKSAGCIRYTLPSTSPATGTTPERADHARAHAARIGMRAAIPPRHTGAVVAETVEQWTARTGKNPDVLPHNFDTPQTTFPGRRPSLNHKRNAA